MSVTVTNLSFSYGERAVLDGISFDVQQGTLVSVLGPNGVGKSTLFRCMLGILSRYTGDIVIDGQTVRGMDARALSRRIAYIPQSHYPAFNYTVLDMVLMGASSHVSAFSSPGKKERDAALAALEKMGIADFAARDYMRISGGERQLVLIARALAQQSRILMMDEPTANLDFGNQMRVLESIRSLTHDGYTVIQSTHNPEQSYLFSDTILAMRGGKLIAQGAPKDVLTSDLIQALYGVQTRVESLFGDRLRVCVPEGVLSTLPLKEDTP